MLFTPRSRRGMVTAPHHLASQAGLSVLRDGGNAVEAVVAMAATLPVVYPHMTGLGGDGFWLIAEPGRAPVAIDACGAAGRNVDVALYHKAGLDAVPWRGGLAANTVAGTVSGWQAALAEASPWGKPLPLARLLEEAIFHAETGMAVTQSQHELTMAKRDELATVPGFADHFLRDGAAPAEGAVLRLPELARTLRRLVGDGLDGFYRGALAADIAADLAEVGSPLVAADLAAHQAQRRQALSVRLSCGQLYNFPPPTQGLASLMILALFDRLGVGEAEGFAHIHGLVEATKQAFLVRDRVVGDPAYMPEPVESWLDPVRLDQLAARIDPAVAAPWPAPPSGGDTTWMGAIDGEGRAVSFIQSIYFEFGSGVVLPRTGLIWQNRGASFRLAENGWNALKPGRKPFHTLNPAMAHLDDGRTMVYGTMGGEGQPQTQSALFSRHVLFGQPLQQAVSAPRWLLGRTWGENSVSLKLENRFAPELVDALRAAGHAVELYPAFSSTMGHAGAIVRQADGWLEGATDPRSDGAVAGF
ncbi:gamma-glutamyltransferase family protein [Magnetospirillum sulfuroxidans]|uniref:Gamma-glutamyltransferase family protein n=1 Tax=Magnetospirillum sulfuroxidans TaxID=611300 RepID=A0ABS5I7V6_9PROT|nr:gamma-glutamyltransferase family protein [Magnetospirillum sulfuroxidans]MBR9970336.1 gamma-glutamyltransferase family protein [Magnetospirillum sulfuroxidans]